MLTLFQHSDRPIDDRTPGAAGNGGSVSGRHRSAARDADFPALRRFILDTLLTR